MNIDPKQKYSIYALVKLGVLGETRATVIKKIMQGRAGANILKVKIEGKCIATSYSISRGELGEVPEIADLAAPATRERLSGPGGGCFGC